jgi:hypothetical protein
MESVLGRREGIAYYQKYGEGEQCAGWRTGKAMIVVEDVLDFGSFSCLVCGGRARGAGRVLVFLG